MLGNSGVRVSSTPWSHTLALASQPENPGIQALDPTYSPPIPKTLLPPRKPRHLGSQPPPPALTSNPYSPPREPRHLVSLSLSLNPLTFIKQYLINSKPT